VKLQLTNKFLHRVRIHGGEFDSSARAMNRAGEKDTLITYERALEAQADLRKFRGSTIERKQMSTKTTFKRVALVAVAALGLGVVTSVPSNAAPAVSYTVMADTTNGEQIVGGQATVFISLDTGTVTNIVITGGTVLSATESETAQAQTGTQTTGSWSESTTASALNFGTTVVLSRSDAGTTTITATPLSATGVPGTAVTKSVKWVTATSAGTYDHSTAWISGTSLSSGRWYSDSTTAQLSFASTLDVTADATINVTQFNAADTTTVSTLTSTSTKKVVATITGAGSIGSTTNGSDAGASVTIAAGTATPVDYLYVFGDGRNGTATITVSVNDVLVATKTVSFYGTVAGYAASTTTGETLSKKYIAIAASASGADAESATVTIKGLDALKTVQAPGTIYVTTDTATIATASTSSGVVYIYGVGLGTTNVNVCNTASCTSATIKYSFPITVVEKTAASYKVAFDATSYAPGAKVTWTVTATTKTGKPIADGSRAVIGTSTTNMSAPVGTLPTGSLTFVDGVATDFFYAPATSGDFVITTLEGAAHDGYIAGIAASAAYTAAKVANTITITGTADAAIDAANEATDAANAATDAALAAADAADAATAAAEDASAAVAALAKSVNTALNNLKKQITALTKLVNKLLK